MLRVVSLTLVILAAGVPGAAADPQADDLTICRDRQAEAQARASACENLLKADKLLTEAGWTVTEVGRQPWVVQGILRTADAVTPMPGLIVPMLTFAALYLMLSAIIVRLIMAMVRETM